MSIPFRVAYHQDWNTAIFNLDVMEDAWFYAGVCRCTLVSTHLHISDEGSVLMLMCSRMLNRDYSQQEAESGYPNKALDGREKSGSIDSLRSLKSRSVAMKSPAPMAYREESNALASVNRANPGRERVWAFMISSEYGPDHDSLKLHGGKIRCKSQAPPQQT